MKKKLTTLKTSIFQLYTFILYTLIGSGTCGKSGIPLSRIISGQNATHGTWPWQVSFKYGKRLVCGGVLISPKHVLSAGHCFEGVSKHILKVLTVVAGKKHLNLTGLIFGNKSC